VEVVREAGGRPVPRLYGRAAELAEENGIIEMHLSLSFTHSTAVASAVAITQERRPKKDERLDPKAELAALFKQARTLLDEVDVADERAADGPAVVVEGNTEL
jgi:holo-[acyl-carrier protein] synthase